MKRNSSQGQALTELILVIPLFIITSGGFIAVIAQQARRYFDSSSAISIAASSAVFSQQEKEVAGWLQEIPNTPEQVAEAVLNPSELRKNASEREEGMFPDSALLKPKLDCSNNTHNFSATIASNNKSEMNLQTCAPLAAYEKKIQMQKHGAQVPLLSKAISPFRPVGILAWERRHLIALTTSTSAPGLTETFVSAHFMNPQEYPLIRQITFVGATNTARQMSLCLAEFCIRSAAPPPVCAAGGGAAILAARIAQTGKPSGFCPILEAAADAKFRALLFGFHARTQEISVSEKAQSVTNSVTNSVSKLVQ